MSDVPELRVEIRRLGQRYFAITRHADGRELCTSEFQPKPTDLSFPSLISSPDRAAPNAAAQQRAGNGKQVATAEARAISLGRDLYRYLFDAGREFHSFLSTLPAPRRVKLGLLLHPETAELWRLPWEYLHDSRQFLCPKGPLQLFRMRDDPGRVTSTPGAGPLRILVTAPRPIDREALDSERELQGLQSSLVEGIHSGRIVLDILYDASVAALAHQLQRGPYHVLHYIGHSTNQGQPHGFLCFETAEGRTELVSTEQLCSLMEGTGIALAVISTSQGAPPGCSETFNQIATGLLQKGVPGVLTVAASLSSDSSKAAWCTLYTELARGSALLDGLYAARSSVWEIDEQHRAAQRSYDWGVAALYLSSTMQRLVDPDLPSVGSPAPIAQWHAGFPVAPPEILVGRQTELRTLRAALREETNVIGIWGDSGMGKTSLIAQALHTPSIRADNVLVIRAFDLYQPEDILGSLTRFWISQDTPEHQQAAELLLNSALPPRERAFQAQQLVSQHRHIIVLDDLDLALSLPSDDTSNALLNSILLGLLSARGRTTYVLTGSSRCLDLSCIPAQQRQELHISSLQQEHAIQLLNNLPHLNTVSSDDMAGIYYHLGGNPQMLRLYSGWIAAGHDPLDLSQPLPVAERLPEDRAAFLIEATLDTLHPGEYEALTALSVLRAPVSATVLSKVTHIGASHADAVLRRWLELALLEIHHVDDDGTAWYTLPIWVRDRLLGRISAEEQMLLHANAASYYAAPFVDETRRLLLQYGHIAWSEDGIRRLARDGSGVLGQILRQQRDSEAVRRGLKRLLAWQYHLLAAGDTESAVDLTRTLVPVLKRWGYRDLARALLRGCVARLQNADRYESLVELGSLDEEEGRLSQALSVYQETYSFLEGRGSRSQMAYITLRIADVYQRLGQLGAALKATEAALQTMREVGDQRGELLGASRLCQLNRLLGQNQQALVFSQIARELSSELHDALALMNATWEQGRIFSQMGHKDRALTCLQQSLVIGQRLGEQVNAADQLLEIAEIQQDLGKPDAALATLQEALGICERTGRPGSLAPLLRTIGEIYEQQGHLAEALESYERASRPEESTKRQGTT